MEPESELQQLILRQLERETNAITHPPAKRTRRLTQRIAGKIRIQDRATPKLSIYLATVLSTLTALPRPFNH